ncbi:MAG: ArsA family ATPase [Myxococcales bacterium]|nr:ArsA family ATPase [Myxococcales bacterium]
MSNPTSAAPELRLVDALMTRRALVCCGAGGVGKTTVSAALGLAGARLGRRVLVVTIDPSRRLAETLGVARHSAHPSPIDSDRLRALGVSPPGTLDAWMLDPGVVSDRTVNNFAKSPEDAARLLANPVYQGLSRLTAGMQEYTAVEAMHGFVQEGRYDLVILDTPPARNALRFLEAPTRVRAFLDRRIFEFFAPSEAGLIRRITGNVVEKVLDLTLGEGTRRSTQEFFALFGTLLHHLERNQAEMLKFLQSDAVGFLLVTSPQRAAVEEALALEARAQATLGLPLLGRILNQSLAPEVSPDAPPAIPPTIDLLGPTPSPEALAALKAVLALAVTELAEEAEHRSLAASLSQAAGRTWVLPRLRTAASDLEALTLLVDRVLST